MDIVFKRQFSYYLITIYVPGCMLVIVSWVSFWLDPHAVPARVALGVTTLLTMSTQTASINSALPPVAYTKAIDVWQVSNALKTPSLTYPFESVFSLTCGGNKWNQSKFLLLFNCDAKLSQFLKLFFFFLLLRCGMFFLFLGQCACLDLPTVPR